MKRPAILFFKCVLMAAILAVTLAVFSYGDVRL